MARVRLVDVAARAGVSMKTVSNVVNGKSSVNAEMRERVLAAIDELGYRPNATARRLVTGRTGLIAVALPVINVPYFAELAQCLESVARERRFRVLVESTGGDPERERDVVSQQEAGYVDGVICQPIANTQLKVDRLDVETPLVLLGERPAPAGVDHVMIDNVEAARTATQHLIDLGRRRIAFLGHEVGEATATTAHRVAGYREAVVTSGIEFDTGLVIRTASYSAAAGERAVEEAWEAGLRFDALLCRDDMMALGAMRALHSHGVDLPGDVAVVGWDDISASRISFPSLTTISPDKRWIARRAITMIEERVNGFQGRGRHRLAPYRLVARESSAGASTKGQRWPTTT